MAKSTVVRTAGIVAASGAMLAATVAPANAFAVAEVSAPAHSAPALASHSYNYNTWGYEATTTVVENTVVETPSTVAPQATTTTEVSSNVDLSNARETVLAAAYDGIGGSYVWGGKSYKAWDCSGFVSYVYAQAGINLTAYTYTMATELTPTSNPQPGDIVFTNGYAHVGIYVGNGQMISALNPSQGTMLTSVDGGGFMPVDGYYTAGI
ncbi:C40 family peptidase [Rothia nasimurium]|uniref:C40 family peptidase n=1 Tax=Rothia nasimurium TaxID=85336 RepID=UPI001F39C220|nr:C40 family peptidase [Rothia nasimurium]